MLTCYIHQIGNINNPKTYETLMSILRTKMISSRVFLEKEFGIVINDNERPFDGNLPKNDFYIITDELHKDRVSLSDPNNELVKKSIERKSHSTWTCFDYDNIAFAISKHIEPLLVPHTEMKGIVPGEVQVKDKIDSEYIIGLILPLSQEQLLDKNNMSFVDKISEMCKQNNFPLDIYNYEGELIKRKDIGKII